MVKYTFTSNFAKTLIVTEPRKNRPTAIKIFQFQGHKDGIYQLQPAGDGKSFFSAGADGMIVKWSLDEPDQGKLIARVEGSIYGLYYDSINGILYAGQNNVGIHAIDVEAGKRISSLDLGATAFYDIQPLDNKLLVATGSGELVILQQKDLKLVLKRTFSNKSLRTMAIHPSKETVALGFSDQHIRVVDSKHFLVREDWVAHQLSVFTLAYSQDGQFLFSGSRDARIKKWIVNESIQSSSEVIGHLFAINQITLSPDGEHFLTCSMDKTIKIWSVNEMSLLRVLDRTRHSGHRNSVNRLLWLNDDTFVSAGDDRNISVWKFDKNPS